MEAELSTDSIIRELKIMKDVVLEVCLYVNSKHI